MFCHFALNARISRRISRDSRCDNVLTLNVLKRFRRICASICRHKLLLLMSAAPLCHLKLVIRLSLRAFVRQESYNSVDCESSFRPTLDVASYCALPRVRMLVVSKRWLGVRISRVLMLGLGRILENIVTVPKLLHSAGTFDETARIFAYQSNASSTTKRHI